MVPAIKRHYNNATKLSQKAINRIGKSTKKKSEKKWMVNFLISIEWMFSRADNNIRFKQRLRRLSVLATGKSFSLNISYFKFFGRPSYFTRKSLSWKKLWGYWTDLTLKWFLELAAFGLTDKSIYRINKCFDCKNCLETYFRIIDFLLTYLIFQKSSVNNLLSWKNRGGTQWKKRKPL